MDSAEKTTADTVLLFRSDPVAPCPMPFDHSGYVLHHTDRFAEKAALLQNGGDVWTYGALGEAVLGTAAGLRTSAGLETECYCV